MKEGWMKNDEGWLFQAVEGFWLQKDKLMDICECRVTFATVSNVFVKFEFFSSIRDHWVIFGITYNY